MEVHEFQNKIKFKELITNDTNTLLRKINIRQYQKDTTQSTAGKALGENIKGNQYVMLELSNTTEYRVHILQQAST
jgi:hypothetical protein